MKSYHLTQEQVLEIASNLELDGRDITVWTNGYVEFETKTALQLFANAVLDQVLGEQWISVEDRLPDYDVLVIVYVDRSQRSLHNKVRSDYRNQMGCAKRNMWMQTRGDEKITHWMPLPSAPKGKQ